uniref:CNNM transmembrane domain-containing protein n=1 Tax=Araucaria cunninghamii TaxID=56994 RepID=A0A0D6R3G4_ARACU
MAVEVVCCGAKFWIYVLIVFCLVLFAGMMSGLTLGLMSLSVMDLEVLMKSGRPQDRKHASKIMPVVKKQHLLLCTLLICNALAMEALPIFLDSLVAAWCAILLSVTLILLFGEIIPQSVCTRYGLAVGATMAPVVQVLVWICFPVAWPISKLLDFLLGKGHVALFRRAELKTLVDLHGNEAGKGGELTHDETTIIAGALELSAKTAEDAMTPISETFAIDVNAKLDRDMMNIILEKGHSRVPVYYEQPTHIIGLLLVKNLLSIHPSDEVPVKNVTIRKIPCVPANLPLYDILNEFQKGHSHMAVVVRYSGEKEKELKLAKDGSNQSLMHTIHENEVHDGEDVKITVDQKSSPVNKPFTNKKPLHKWKSFPAAYTIEANRETKSKRWARGVSEDILQIADNPLPKLAEDEEVVGIITMEDVIEELLKEEILDETDIPEDAYSNE